MKKPTLRSTLLAAAIAAMSGHAYAAGLGRINVLSSLGQPLRAEIEVAATPEELETMSARLAPVDAFKRANIEYSGVLSGVRMSIERRGNSAIVRVASDRPVGEPFVDMLVELNWAGGRLLREYTFLLDPPATTEPAPAAAQGSPVPMVPSAPVTTLPGTSSASGATPRPPIERPASSSQPQVRPEAAKQAADGEYKVEQGDTLSSIARELKASEVSQDQMLAALYQSNSSAFIGGNINRLRAGRILTVPSADDAKAIAPREARQIILKASDFDGYRQQVADAAKAAPARGDDASQSASGKIAPRVDDPAATAAQGQDKLKIAKTQVAPAGAAATDPKAAARVQALEEDIASREKALKESRDRVAALEKNVKELQALIELKNKNLADLQKQAQAAEASAKDAQKKADALAKAGDAQRAAEAKTAAAAAAKAAADARKAAEDARKAEDLRKQEEAKRLADEKKTAEAKAQEDARLAAEAARAEEERKAAEARAAEEAAKLAAEQSAAAAAAAAAIGASEPLAAEMSAPAAEPAPEVAEPAQPVAPPPAPAPVAEVEEESFFPGGTMGMLLAAVLALGGLVLLYKRQRRGKSAMMNTTAMSEASTSPNSVFGSAGGQTVDTGTSVLHTDFSQSGLSAIDTDEGVDPVAEADVYMAYGRDAQAEEILLDALKSDPGRAAIYGKLLEIYAQRKSVKQFENIATDLFTQTGGAGDEWTKAAALGRSIDPENPLYRNGAAAGVAPAAAVTAAALAPVIPEAPEAPAATAPDAQQAVTFGTNNVSQMRATWTMPGEINQFTGDGTELAQPSAVSVATEPEPLNLDFNLDLELPNEEDPQTRMETHQDDDMLLPLAEQTVEDTAGADAPLEFDLGGVGNAPAAAAPAARPEPTPVRAAALSDADLGIERNLVDEDNLAVVDLEKTNFESNVLDFDFELGEETKGPAASDRSVDLSDIGVRTTGVKPAAAAPAGNEVLPDSIDLNEEVSTKLELARAYEEMGDIEGARELLEEVVADGAVQQKEEARQILTRIG